MVYSTSSCTKNIVNFCLLSSQNSDFKESENECVVYKQPASDVGKVVKFERHRPATEVGSKGLSPGLRESLPNTETGFCHFGQS